MRKIDQNLINNINEDISFIEILQKKYKNNLDKIKKELSIEAGFYLTNSEREVRKLNKNEVISSLKYLGCEFSDYNIIPIFDIMDNNYIVYMSDQDKFAIFNIIDEVLFDKVDTIIELLS